MPSPIAHLAAGYIVYTSLRRHDPGAVPAGLRTPEALFAATAVFSLLPDVDAAVGVISGDMLRSHGAAMHSVAAGVVVALATGLGMQLGFGGKGRFWFVLAFTCYGLHILMDSFTVGRGVMLLWPLSEVRVLAPVSVFFGLRWSQGWWSTDHLITLATELPLALLTVGAARWLACLRDRRRRITRVRKSDRAWSRPSS
jgi:membrane-bound metal-dependent hydrolase YbcI (DUF457 family)